MRGKISKVLFDVLLRYGVNIRKLEYSYFGEGMIIVNGEERRRVPAVDASIFVTALLNTVKEIFGEYEFDGENLYLKNIGLRAKIIRHDKYNVEVVFG